MRIGSLILSLFGVTCITAITLHSNVSYVLQPAQNTNFYVPKQTGVLHLTILEGNNNIEISGGCGGTVQTANTEMSYFIDTFSFAPIDSDTTDFYISVFSGWSVPFPISFELRVIEPVTAVNGIANFPLLPNGIQHVRIPAEANHGLALNISVQCNDGSNEINIAAKSASGYLAEEEYQKYLLYENEDILVIVKDTSETARQCTLSYASRSTVVITNGLNTISLDHSTPTVGTRYVPTVSSYHLLSVETSEPVSTYVNGARTRPYGYSDYFIVDGRFTQNFVFDTSKINGDQLNVTVNPVTTVMLTSGVNHTFQCTRFGENHPFAIVGTANSGAALEVLQTDGLSLVHTFYSTKDEPSINNFDTHNGDGNRFPTYAEANNVVWTIIASCNGEGDAAITVSLPEFQTIGLGSNIISVGPEQRVYLRLPEGPNQSSLSVHVNSTSIDGFYCPYSLLANSWNFNNVQNTDVVYAYTSPILDPSWWFVIEPQQNSENIQITLASKPIVTIESGKKYQFETPNDATYGSYVIVAKLEANNGLGHAFGYVTEYDNDFDIGIAIFENGFVDLNPRKKRNNVVSEDVHVSNNGNTVFYIAIYTDVIPSLNFTATFAPVTTAVDGVIDFSRSAQQNEQYNAIQSFLFPAKRRYNAAFAFNVSASSTPVGWGFDESFSYFQEVGNNWVSFFLPDSLGAYFVYDFMKGSSASVYLKSLATVGLCNSQLDCNGHGSCETIANQCTCTDGYSGDWCEVSPAPTDDNNNSSADRIVVTTCQVLLLTILFIAF